MMMTVVVLVVVVLMVVMIMMEEMEEEEWPPLPRQLSQALLPSCSEAALFGSARIRRFGFEFQPCVIFAAPL